ncbi:NAD(P)-dependent dehydrogenase (short-subunit alcohol dehydrogenase family) [Acinetobacter baylyi]|uniref:SDR family NAD(P)-dependent oxidoreductase n=1 Tax=Acinetobacter baylyi TaxID=202950 RepID=UPI002866FA13|nr:SDR family NAD(P)-dependent oxidoreductase [Acinetobacter baylyi]MDR6105442.1 NAD(P)-dependent dehydrogenase (short-subunit alcohol dehydrogenase family) [Acinetobacter baylyi]
MQKLKGKVALVTGGGRGIGRAICEAMAKEGARVGVLDLKHEVALESVNAIQAQGGEAIALVGNVAQREDLINAVTTLKQQFGCPRYFGQ